MFAGAGVRTISKIYLHINTSIQTSVHQPPLIVFCQLGLSPQPHIICWAEKVYSCVVCTCAQCFELNLKTICFMFLWRKLQLRLEMILPDPSLDYCKYFHSSLSCSYLKILSIGICNIEFPAPPPHCWLSVFWNVFTLSASPSHRKREHTKTVKCPGSVKVRNWSKEDEIR